MIGLVIPADVELEPYTVEWAREAELLPLLYRHIACESVDSFNIRNGAISVTVWVDDEGLLSEAPQLNPRMLTLAHALGYMAEALAGNAFITGPVAPGGDMTGLPEELVAAFNRLRERKPHPWRSASALPERNP